MLFVNFFFNAGFPFGGFFVVRIGLSDPAELSVPTALLDEFECSGCAAGASPDFGGLPELRRRCFIVMAKT